MIAPNFVATQKSRNHAHHWAPNLGAVAQETSVVASLATQVSVDCNPLLACATHTRMVTTKLHRRTL